MKRNDKCILLIVLLIFLLVITILPFCVNTLGPWLIQMNDPQAFQTWLQGFSGWASVIMIICVILKVILPFLPGKVLEVAAGYCFGFWPALCYVLLANALGTLFVRWLVKRFGMRLVSKLVDEETVHHFPIWKDEQRFALLLWITYLIPGTPKDALTYVISLSNMRTVKLVMITTFARCFTVSAGILGGTAMSAQNYTLAFLLLMLFLILSAIGLYLYQKQLKNHKTHSSDQ